MLGMKELEPMFFYGAAYGKISEETLRRIFKYYQKRVTRINMSYFNKDLEDIGFKLYEPCEELEAYIYNYWSIKNKIDSRKTK